MRVHQLYCAAIPGDAIGNLMLELDLRLRSWGLESFIFAPNIAPENVGRVSPHYE